MERLGTYMQKLVLYLDHRDAESMTQSILDGIAHQMVIEEVVGEQYGQQR